MEATLTAVLAIKARLEALDKQIDVMNNVKSSPKKKSGCEHYIAEKTSAAMNGEFSHLTKETRQAKRKELIQKYRAEYKTFSDTVKEDWTKKAEVAPPRTRGGKK